ncbi:MAG: glycoside hydrolase family 15 protein [Bryobacteraceae bacterium]
MNENIDNYGLIGDTGTAALISAKGNLRWLCWPDFDSEACFASLLGTDENGVWSLAPASFHRQTRRYIPGTLVLETTYKHLFGATVSVTDFMPKRDGHSTVVRIVRGVNGQMKMRTRFAPRLDYGNAQLRIDRDSGDCWSAVAGPNRLTLRTNVKLQQKEGDLEAEWVVKAGETYFFTLQQSVSYAESPPAIDALQVERETATYWSKWISKSTYQGRYKEAVDRSLLTLAALTDSESGGFVAAPTTSLPEKVGGIRNWDYRFCWLRDTTFSLISLTHCGYTDEAKAWLNWLSRSVQGSPAALKIMYGVTGKREHSEWTANWLSGYKGSRPVHIGNKASDQLQLDTFGEVLDSLYHARCHGLYPLEDHSGEALELPLLEHLERLWVDPDDGLWEFRTKRQQFTQSKLMAWVAFDRGICMVERFGVKGPVERWRKIRTKIHDQVCKNGFHKGLNSFTQVYGTRHLDASLLLLPLLGFLPIADPRITGTVKAIEKHLLRNGLLLRYDTARVKDGLPAGEGAFLACSFWLVDVYVLQGRREEATTLFEKLIGLSNDLQLLSEEYDPKEGLIGNFPQAFSHIGLIDAALALQSGIPPRLQHLT